MVAPRFRSWRKRKMFSAFPISAVAGPVVALGRVTVGGENCPVVVPPMVFPAPVLNILMPSCFSMFRSTLAKRTFKRICGWAGGTST